MKYKIGDKIYITDKSLIGRPFNGTCGIIVGYITLKSQQDKDIPTYYLTQFPDVKNSKYLFNSDSKSNLKYILLKGSSYDYVGFDTDRKYMDKLRWLSYDNVIGKDVELYDPYNIDEYEDWED